MGTPSDAAFSEAAAVNTDEYFAMCSFRRDGVELTSTLEDRIEAASAATGPGGKEALFDHWETGVYACSRCKQELYTSRAKWKGPCAWPSFRKPLMENSISTRLVSNYNGYKCEVAEVFCSG